MWIDCHAHLDCIEPADLDNALGRAREAGVGRIVHPAEDEASFDRVRDMTRRHDHVFGNLGVHPHHASAVTEETYAKVQEGMAEEKMIAVGEIGLDFHYERSPREVQMQVLGRFLDLALAVNKPVVLHNRESAQELLRLLRPRCAKGLRGMLHSFTEGWEYAKAFLDLGLYISFSGILTFKNAQALREVAGRMPADRMMVETDTPFLAPMPMRGKTNEPAFVVHTAGRLAELRGVPKEELALQMQTNCRDLFGWPIIV